MKRFVLTVILSIAWSSGGLTPQFSGGRVMAQASTKAAPTIDQWLSFNYASNPQISPDGLRVAYQTISANWDTNAFENRIWIVAATGGDSPRQLTNFKGSSYGVEWSPDSRRIAFLSTRDGRPQVYLMEAAGGGDPVKLTEVEAGVNSFDWSPDGRRIAFTTSDPEPEERKSRRERFGDFQILGEPAVMLTHLWMIEAPFDSAGKRAPERLTRGAEFSVGGYSWSPDSAQIAFSGANPAENYGAFRGPEANSWTRADIYTLKISDKSVRKIVTTRGPDFNPLFSPDGKQIAYTTSNAARGRDFNFEAILYIAVVPAEGGTPRLLTTEFDESPSLLAWSPAGIYFSALQKTYSHLFRLSPETKAIERVSSPERAIYSQFSFSRDFQQSVFLSESGSSIAEVEVSSPQSFGPRRLTAMNNQLRAFKHGTREVIAWRSKDGTPIEGVLVKPADFDPSKKYPLLVVIHTGPTVVDQAALNPFNDIYPIEPLAARGALVLLPNYRGSIGYGEKFRLLLVRNLGLPQYWDVITGVDHLIARGLVDRDRVGAMGYSHGGYIAAFIAAYSDRFKAVSVGAGVSDWRIFYTNSDTGPGMLNLLKATPWDDPQYYREVAPLSYVKNARTPTLIQHGSLDQRAPLAGSFELYRALKDQGVAVKMIVYRGAGHGGSSWTIKQYSSLKRHNYEWFSEWLWGEKSVR